MTHADTPERIDIVIVNGDPNPNRPDLPHYGAGETVCKPTLAAVANAIDDATGVRLRRVPFPMRECWRRSRRRASDSRLLEAGSGSNAVYPGRGASSYGTCKWAQHCTPG